DQTISSAGNVTVQSVTSAEKLTIAAGNFNDAGNLSGSGQTSIEGGTFVLSGSNWSNTESINLISGNLNLGGSFTTAGLGTITRVSGTAGVVNLTGTLNNSGATLTLDTANNGTGSWNLAGGTIFGGTVATANNAILTATANSTLGTTTAGTGVTL